MGLYSIISDKRISSIRDLKPKEKIKMKIDNSIKIALIIWGGITLFLSYELYKIIPVKTNIIILAPLIFILPIFILAAMSMNKPTEYDKMLQKEYDIESAKHYARLETREYFEWYR